MKKAVILIIACALGLFFWDQIFPDPELAVWNASIDKQWAKEKAILEKVGKITDKGETLSLYPAWATTSGDFARVALQARVGLRKIELIDKELVALYLKKPHNLPLTKKEQKELAMFQRRVSELETKNTEKTSEPTQQSVPEPTPIPPKVFPIVRTIRGAFFKNVAVQHREPDGFLIGAGNQSWKVYDFELDPQTRAALTAECR